MPWNGKRTLKPLHTADTCLCSTCEGCLGIPSFGVRCDDCHFGPGGKHHGQVDWQSYCRSVHWQQPCQTIEEHKARYAGDTRAIVATLDELPRTMDIGAAAQWGQLSFETAAVMRMKGS